MKVIVNPAAGRGRGSKQIPRLRKLLKERRIEHELLITRERGHATELAKQLVESGVKRVIVAGGDGTISEVVNGLAGTSVEIGIVSFGTGNDIARTLNLPYNDVARALDVAVAGRVRDIDLGMERGRFFVSGAGLGFAADVVEQSRRATWLRGPAAFFYAVHRVLHRLRVIEVLLEINGQAREVECVAVLVQNTAYTGGGLLIAPRAMIDDGLLDVVIIGPIGRLDLVWNFPRLYRGTHTDHPKFALFRASKVRIETAVPLPKMMDGDIWGASPLEAEVAS